MKKNKTILGLIKQLDCKLSSLINKCTIGEGAFLVSSLTDDACNTLALPLDKILYHDGEGEFPELGDTVYSDESMTIPFVTEQFEEVFMGGDELDLNNWLRTDSNGVREVIFCK